MKDSYPRTGNEELDSISQDVLNEMRVRMTDNYPYAHPLYAGQMLKPPHAIAREAYHHAQSINPNNHALDGGKASSAMEIEAVAEIAGMMGFEQHLGHLTGGGTMANLEALWVAGQIHPGRKIVASTAAHYTHERISQVLQLPFSSIPASHGRMDLGKLRTELETGSVGTVVVTAGTTGTGHVEPIANVIGLCREFGVRVHVDAAYGGYFCLVDFKVDRLNLDFEAISRADSVVIDPHKHGLQPYGCGCVLFSDPSVGKFYRHNSPYTYFTSDELHLGEISLECSRPGAAAVALWTTQRRFPLVKNGEMSEGLAKCLKASRTLYDLLTSSGEWLLPYSPDLDIIVFAPSCNSTTEISEMSQRIFDACEAKGLYLALYQIRSGELERTGSDLKIDSAYTTVLRSTLMKWNHLEFIPEIFSTLSDVRKSLM